MSGPPDEGYNCVGWTVDRLDAFLWPPAWFSGDPFDAFDAFYASHGFARAADSPPSGDVIAVYGRPGEPLHVARRVLADADGWWESKLGRSVRIVHRLRDLDGGVYGHVLCYYAPGSAGGEP